MTRVYTRVYSSAMPTKDTTVVAVRVPQWLAQAIRAEADALGMTQNAVLARRLATAYSHEGRVRKSDENVAKRDTEVEVE